MKKIDPRVRQFLDTEAQVDEEGFSEEEDEATDRDREDAFIDDGVAVETGHSVLPVNFSVHQHIEDALESLISRIGAKRTASTHRRYTTPEDASETSLDRGLVYIPRRGDHPLWRVECRIGVEELAVVSLLNRAAECHQIRSAFTQGSIRGSIYIECTMNEDLINLLLLTPGILRNNLGIKRRLVDSSEYAQVLRMRDGREIVEVGSWVLVKKGLYKGDVGIVSQKSFLGARILLIPRLDATPQNPLKRKASTVKPIAKLFDADHFGQLFPVDVEGRGHGYYSFGQLEFEQGLLAKDFDYHSFTVDVKDIPYDFYTMFRISKHPSITLSKMPRPREWSMKENDKVLIRVQRSDTTSSFAPAILKVLDTYYAEVEQIWTHDEPPGHSKKGDLTIRVSWQDMRKEIKIGQHIFVRGGLHVGKKGWVVNVEDDQASVVSKKIEGDIPKYLKDDDDAIESFEVFVNFVDVTEEPAVVHYKREPDKPAAVYYEREPESGPLPPSTPRHPWCGVKVKISKRHHSRKGETGVIQEVIEHRDENMIMLHLQLTRYDPNAPFHRITVRYDDVVEYSSCYELVHFLDPGEGHLRPEPKQQLSKPQPKQGRDGSIHALYLPAEKPSGSVTPLPTPIHSSSLPLSPAWDPSSSTPSFDSPTSNSRMSDSWTPAPLQPAAPPHVLLNPKLVGIKLNAVVDGGGFVKQQISVSMDLQDNRVVLRHKRYHTWISLEPHWVTPKYPHPIHDNNLLVVIKGIHCGKYVRRIHHRQDKDLTTAITIILSVVNRTEGSPDSLSGEQLELDPQFLCTVPETKKERDLNWRVMTSIRAMYHHRPNR